MCKLKSFIAAIFIFLTFEAANANEQIRVDAESSVRGGCGLEIGKIRGLVLEARAIPPDASKSRVDNDRFTACPYRVSIRYDGKTMNVDFSREFTLADVKEYDGVVDIKAGYLNFDHNGWNIASDMRASDEVRMSVHDSESSLFVGASFRRKLLIAGKTDYCVAIAVIGHSRYAVSSLCDQSKTALKFLDSLLSDKTFLRFTE